MVSRELFHWYFVVCEAILSFICDFISGEEKSLERQLRAPDKFCLSETKNDKTCINTRFHVITCLIQKILFYFLTFEVDK